MQDNKRNRRRTIIIVCKICISTLLLILLFYRTDPVNVFRSFKTYSYTTIFLAIVITTLSGFWAAVKWKLLLWNVPFLKILGISFIRYFYSLVLIGQVTGDIARIYKMGKESQGNVSLITASVLVDRMTGFVGLFLVSAFGVLFTKIQLPAFLIWMLLIATIGSVLVLLCMRFSLFQHFMAYLLGFLRDYMRLPPRILIHFNTFVQALHVYSKKSMLIVLSVLFGVVLQLLCVTYTALLANGIEMNVAFIDWCWIFGIMTILLFLPISISGIGVREGGFVGLLGIIGVASEKALALSLSVFGLHILLAIWGAIIDFRGTVRS